MCFRRPRSGGSAKLVSARLNVGSRNRELDVGLGPKAQCQAVTGAVVIKL
jgi:hypothetical protein